jgi:hypothetical protein
LTSKVLNAAIRKDPSTENVVELKDGASNHRTLPQQKQENNGQVYYYDLTLPGCGVDELVLA